MQASDDSNRRLISIDDNAAIHEDYRKVLANAPERSEVDDLFASVMGCSVEQESKANFDLHSAMQGQEALELVVKAQSEGRPFAAAFVDMRMPPGWDGLETVMKLWEVDPRIQIAFCTAYSDHSWSEIQSRLGVNSPIRLVQKPFDPTEICELAEQLCSDWNTNYRPTDIE